MARYYVDGNNVLKREPKEYRKNIQKKKIYIRYAYNRKEQSKSLPIFKFVLYFVLSCMFFICAGISLKIQSDISTCQRQIHKLESEYTELQNENEDRLTSIEGNININDIKLRAKELGMSLASDEQIQEIN